MRLWSIHPKYLDSKGLVALWREALLAQKVLSGQTKGYRNHPQLTRFRSTSNPLGSLATYLREVKSEADRRGYNFDGSKIPGTFTKNRIRVSDSQVEYEISHLKNKLKVRAPEKLSFVEKITSIETHPLFQVVSGPVEPWEIVE